MTRPLSQENWIVACTHPDHTAFKHDLSEFAVGAPAKRTGTGAHRWAGGFSGRPGLIRDLLPIIRAKHARGNPSYFIHVVSTLRGLYRFLDGYERVLKRQLVAYQPVEHLHHLTGPHLDLMIKPGPDGAWDAHSFTATRILRTLIFDAIHAHDLPPLYLPALPRARWLRKDVPTEDEGVSIIRFLRSEVLAIFARWQRADRLAAEGRNLLAIKRGRSSNSGDVVSTEADAHATYRAIIAQTGHLAPTYEMVREAFGYCTTSRRHFDLWPRYREGDQPPPGSRVGDIVNVTDLIKGLYPAPEDIFLCALLCLGRSAWNAATLFSLNIANWCNRYDDQAIWVFAPKARAGGAYQYTVARAGERTGIYRIVSSLIERSAPLRSWLQKDPDMHPTPDIALRSPWFGINASKSHGRLLFTVDPGGKHNLSVHLKNVIERHNQSPSAKVQVRDMSASDFRDVAAVWVYKKSRYSVWVTMVLLGHKYLPTTRGYLETHAARQESHALVKSVMDDVFEQIGLTQTWDPALTRAKVEGVDVSPEAKDRLDAYRRQRTYDGSLCGDPFHPPRRIDPNNPQNGRVRCIQGHRCVASRCPNANVFRESLPWLARRAAELEWMQQRVGTVKFSVSSDAQDLAQLRDTLTQWPELEVETALNHWRRLLERGTHRPVLLAGLH